MKPSFFADNGTDYRNSMLGGATLPLQEEQLSRCFKKKRSSPRDQAQALRWFGLDFESLWKILSGNFSKDDISFFQTVGDVTYLIGVVFFRVWTEILIITLHVLHVCFNLHVLHVCIALHVLYVCINLHVFYVCIALHVLYVCINLHVLTLPARAFVALVGSSWRTGETW